MVIQLYTLRKLVTPTQQNYGQIEKEMLAVLFACKRFDQYICGKKNLTIESDHSPSINIFKKPLLKIPKRLQSMIPSLHRYNFDIKYKKGTEMYAAGTLSIQQICHRMGVRTQNIKPTPPTGKRKGRIGGKNCETLAEEIPNIQHRFLQITTSMEKYTKQNRI